MITKEQAMKLRYGEGLHFTGKRDCRREVGPRGGVKEFITNVRVSGRCKTWKRDKARFHIPVKYGLYEHSWLDQDNQKDFHLPADCPLEQEGK